MKLIRYQTSPLFSPSANYPTHCAMKWTVSSTSPFPRSARCNAAACSAIGRANSPSDLYQAKDAFKLRAELPGFRKEDISLEVADGVLTLTGHQKTDTKSNGTDKESATATQERRVSRAISLPENLDLEKIQAAYENGVLTVTLPKREEVKPKQIAIEVK